LSSSKAAASMPVRASVFRTSSARLARSSALAGADVKLRRPMKYGAGSFTRSGLRFTT
jgi:hypothetical protein